VQPNGLCYLIANAKEWIQRSHRLLEDHGNPLAPNVPHLYCAQLQQILAVEHDLSLHDSTWWLLDQPKDRKGCDALTTARLPHKTQGLPSANGKINPIDCFDHSIICVEICVKVSYSKQDILHNLEISSKEFRTFNGRTKSDDVYNLGRSEGCKIFQLLSNNIIECL
jgi:hypothetical protein